MSLNDTLIPRPGAQTVEQFFTANPDACEEAQAFARQFKTMAEAWDACPRADWMFYALGRTDYNDERLLRLYACRAVRETPLADGRKVWDLLTDGRSRRAVEVAELYADGKATAEELDAARAAARDAAWAAASGAARAAARDAARAAALDAAWAAASGAARDAAWAAAYSFQADLLREVIGNPFKVKKGRKGRKVAA